MQLTIAEEIHQESSPIVYLSGSKPWTRLLLLLLLLLVSAAGDQKERWRAGGHVQWKCHN